jgi:hypothetical protein
MGGEGAWDQRAYSHNDAEAAGNGPDLGEDRGVWPRLHGDLERVPGSKRAAEVDPVGVLDRVSRGG